MKLHAFTISFILLLLTPFTFTQTTPIAPPATAEMRATTLYQRIVQQGGPNEVGVYNSNQFVSLIKPTTVTCPAGPGANPVPSTCLVTVTVIAEMDNSDPRSAGTYGAFRINTRNDPFITNVNKKLTSFNHVWKSDSIGATSGYSQTSTRSFTFLLSVSSNGSPHTFWVELGCLNSSGGNACYQGTYGDDPFSPMATPKGGPAISVITDVFKPAM